MYMYDRRIKSYQVRSIRRRGFVKRAGASVGAAAVIGSERGAAGGPESGIDAEWKIEFDTVSVTPPTAMNGSLFFGREGDVFATDVVSGARKWSTSLDGGHVQTKPTVDRDAVSVSTFQAVYRLAREDGEIFWKVDTGWGGNGKPVQVSGITYVDSRFDEKHDRPGTVHAIDSSSGSKLWEYEMQDEIAGDLLPGADGVIVTDAVGRVVHLNNQGGVEWQFETENQIRTPATRTRGFVVFSDVSGTIRALDRGTGSEVWQAQLPQPAWRGAVGANKEMVAVTSNSRVKTLQLETGVERWQHDVRGRIESVSAVSDGTYVTTSGGRLYGFDSRAGGIEMDVQFPEMRREDAVFAGLAGGPVTRGKKVFVTTAGGSVIALDHGGSM